MPTETPKPEIQIIAYVAINDIQQLTDDGKLISRYVRSFRYEHHDDPLVCRRNAFYKLLDEKEARLFGYDINPEQQLRGLSLYMEYLVPYNNGKGDKGELKKLYLLTGKPMRTEDQLVRWEKELHLLQAAYPKIHLPIIPVRDDMGTTYEILETPYWTLMYYFYEG